MKFRSIQFSVAALAGAIVLSVVAALVLYALFSGARTQEMVQQRTQAQFEQVIEQRLTSLAQTQVSQIQRELEAPLLIAGGLVRVNALLGTPAADGQPRLSVSREQLISLIKENVEKNPKILGTYIGWEKNALDHNDAAYVGTSVVGIDAANGRFLPWWFRNDDGTLGLDKLVDVDDQKTLSTGVRASEYYLCSKETKKACVIDPAPYKVGDKIVMLASFIEPIMLNGAFQGIVGADLSVNFIQEMLLGANQKLYSGAGQMALIGGNGRIVAYTKDPSKFGEKVSDILDAEQIANMANLKRGEVTYSVNKDKGRIELYLPFGIGQTDAHWTLMLQLPLNAVMADLQKLQGDLEAQRKSDTFGMAMVGLLIAGLGLLVIWLVGHGIARPLKQMVAMLNDIAQGEGDLTRRLTSDRRDELGSIAKGFNTFLAKLQAMITQVVTSVQSVSDSSEHTADIAIRTNIGIQKQMAEIDQVATAVQEMTATAQDVARNATQAAQAASHADQAASQGMQIVRDTSNSIGVLALEIGKAVDVVRVMEDSQNRTDESVQHAAKAAEALETITRAVSVINDMNTQIASAAEEQSAVADDINRNVINIGQVANEVAGGADESSSASADLTKLAEQQRRLINQFKV